jgi:hypothetical protein
MKVKIHISHRRSLNPVLERTNGNEYLLAAGRPACRKEELDLNSIIDDLTKVNPLTPQLKVFLLKSESN